MKKSEFNIAIIGAGKIAASLTAELVKKHSVEVIISKNINAAQQLAKLNSIKYYSTQLKDIPSKVNLVLLAVPDDQIKIIARQLSKLKINHKEKIYLHLSGSENISSLTSLKLKDASVSSLHIMQTFPSKKNVDIKNSFASIEADTVSTSRKIFELAKSIGLKPFTISSAQKTLYHLSGVFSSNFLVGNFFAAQKIYSQQNKQIALNKLLTPITQKTLSNILKDGTSKTLSGPIERGDYKTIQHHLSEMKSNGFSANDKKLGKLIKVSYVVQSLILLHIAEEKFRKLSANHKKIQKLLNSELKNLKV